MSDEVQVDTGRIPAVKVQHDKRGDYGMEEVQRSPLSYLSTTTTAPSTKPPSLTVPPTNTGSFSMPAAKASRFQQHADVFSWVNSGMDLGSPKVPTATHLIPLHSYANVQIWVDHDADGVASQGSCSTCMLRYSPARLVQKHVFLL